MNYLEIIYIYMSERIEFLIKLRSLIKENIYYRINFQVGIKDGRAKGFIFQHCSFSSSYFIMIQDAIFE